MTGSSLRRGLFSGFSFWMVICLVTIYYLLPLRNSLRFGMDLVGGTYITLEVHADKAIEEELLDKQEVFIAKLKEQNAPHYLSTEVRKKELLFTYDSTENARAAEAIIKGSDRALKESVEGNQLKIYFIDSQAIRIREEAVRKNIEVLRTRLDKLGVAEISIVAQGEKNIVVELPDVSDPQQAKAMIGKAAVLEFKLVHKVGKNKEDVLYDYDGQLPAGMELVKGQDGFSYAVSRRADLSGKYLKDARPNFDEQKGQMVVGFTLTKEGGDKFYELTSRNYGKQLAVILDDVVITAPVIQASISDQGSISGKFNAAEAKELALLLKSGAFVAPVTFEEERQIGPLLGAESIHRGFISCLVGLGLLFVFSLWYYSICGLFAFVTLLVNMLFILLGLSWLGATLTLPGVAGIVLTLGMAVDASILIYEKIKEELASGVTVRRAVKVGFSDATRIILDANITTLIVGVVLYYFGTGPIQGFAVTLMLGIISTLITGLFFLKSVFNVVLDTFDVKTLKI